MVELKERVEIQAPVKIILVQEPEIGKKLNRNMRELQVSGLYNPRYYEEKERYETNLNALRAYYAISYYY